MAKPIRSIVSLVLLAGLVDSAVGYWRYRVTRPEYRLRRGQEAVLQGDVREAATVFFSCLIRGGVRPAAKSRTAEFTQAQAAGGTTRFDSVRRGGG
jgi:hypothetical protein